MHEETTEFKGGGLRFLTPKANFEFPGLPDGPVDKLLHHVAYSDYVRVSEMVIDDSLVLEKGNVTDPAGRRFEGITALQYSFWALDSPMFKMLKGAINSEEVSKEQIEGAFTGIWVNQHGVTAKCLIEKLIEELKEYVSEYGKNLKNNEAENVKFWRERVGSAQKELPFNILILYLSCKFDERYVPTPELKGDEDESAKLVECNACIDRGKAVFDYQKNEIAKLYETGNAFRKGEIGVAGSGCLAGLSKGATVYCTGKGENVYKIPEIAELKKYLDLLNKELIDPVVKSRQGHAVKLRP